MLQRRRNIVQRLQLQDDDTLIDQLKFAIAARLTDRPGLPDLIPLPNQRHYLADGFHHPEGIPIQYSLLYGVKSHTDFGIHWVNENRLHLDKQIVAASDRYGKLDGG